MENHGLDQGVPELGNGAIIDYSDTSIRKWTIIYYHISAYVHRMSPQNLSAQTRHRINLAQNILRQTPTIPLRIFATQYVEKRRSTEQADQGDAKDSTTCPTPKSRISTT
jgi:hypothetical protein